MVGIFMAHEGQNKVCIVHHLNFYLSYLSIYSNYKFRIFGFSATDFYESNIVHSSTSDYKKPKKQKTKTNLKDKKEKTWNINSDGWISEFPAESEKFDHFRDEDAEFLPTDMGMLLKNSAKTSVTSKSDLKRKLKNIKSSNQELTSENILQYINLFKRLRSLSNIRKTSILDAVSKEIEKRQLSFNAELKAYIDVCISCGLVGVFFHYF